MNTHVKDSQTERARAADHPSQAVVEKIGEIELAMLRPLGTFGVAMIDAWADILAESASFVAERLRQDARTQHRILHCRTPGELHEIQAEWFQKVIDEYREEAGRMSTLIEKTTRKAVGAEDKAA